jgi:hypothetical protein
MTELKENEVIGRLIEKEKYKFVDPRLIAEIVKDVYELQATAVDGLEREDEKWSK